MPRKVAYSTKSCAARISTEPSMPPCGGRNRPRAAKHIPQEKAAIDTISDTHAQDGEIIDLYALP